MFFENRNCKLHQKNHGSSTVKAKAGVAPFAAQSGEKIECLSVRTNEHDSVVAAAADACKHLVKDKQFARKLCHTTAPAALDALFETIGEQTLHTLKPCKSYQR